MNLQKDMSIIFDRLLQLIPTQVTITLAITIHKNYIDCITYVHQKIGGCVGFYLDCVI